MDEQIDQSATIRKEWPEIDDHALLIRIQKVLPVNDVSMCYERMDTINWEKIKFKSYSAEDCKNHATLVVASQRHFKTLGEVLKDAAEKRKRDSEQTLEEAAKLKEGKKLKLELKNLPDFPRKPASDFVLYFQDHKDEIFSQNPELNYEAARQVVLDKFKKLDAEQKAVYVEKAAKAMEEYQPQLKQFLDQYPNHPQVIRYLKIQYGVLEKPTAIGLYIMEHKDEFSGFGRIKKIFSKRFQSLDAEQKAVYEEKVEKAMEEYYLKLQQLVKDHPNVPNIHHLKLNLNSSLSTAEKLQSDLTSEIDLAKETVGVKRPMTESGELKQQKNKKMRYVFEKTEISTELQLAAKEDGSDKLFKKKRKNKSSASLNHLTEPTCVAVSVEVEVKKEASKEKSVGLKQKKGKKKRPSAKII